MHKLEKKEDQQINSFESVEQHSTSTTTKSLFRNWPLMSSITLFCIACFEDMAYSEVCFNTFE